MLQRLTSAGRRLLEKAAPLWRLAQEEVGKLLGDGAVKMLDETVKRLQRSGSSK